MHQLLSDLKTGLRAIYGRRLRALFLFGSYARGEEDKESDIDVIVILDNYERYGIEVDRASGISAKLSLRYGVSISKVFFREHDWKEGDTPFLSNVRQEAIPA